MGKKLYERIADDLLSRIQSTPDYVFPPIRQLIGEWRVSNTTMSKAIHLLAKKGIVTCVHGRRTVLCAPGGAPTKVRLSPLGQELLDAIRNGVMNGRYRLGEPLPKILFFGATYHVSSDTVVHVLSLLRDENLIHKRGKRWIAGPAPKRVDQVTGSRSPTRAPVILMIAYDEEDWIDYFDNSHTRPFAVSFNSEISRHGMRMELFLIEGRPKRDPRALEGTAYASMNDLRSTVAALGDRYAGTFFICQAKKVRHALPWMSEMCLFHRPVLYFDTTAQALKEIRELMKGHEEFHCLQMNEQGAVRLAVDALAGSGHQRIGIPSIERRPVPWVTQRMRLIGEYTQVRRPPIEAPMAATGNALWNMEHPASVHHFVSTLADQYAQANRSASRLGIRRSISQRHMLLSKAPEFTSFLRENAPTAIIALNDYFARQYYYWFRAVGIDVPRHISMISFDNIPESITFPIDSIDFGFTALGFQAAHILIDDLPQHSRQSRLITAVPHLLDRGSIAPPSGGIPEHLLQ